MKWTFPQFQSILLFSFKVDCIYFFNSYWKSFSSHRFFLSLSLSLPFPVFFCILSQGVDNKRWWTKRKRWKEWWRRWSNIENGEANKLKMMIRKKIFHVNYRLHDRKFYHHLKEMMRRPQVKRDDKQKSNSYSLNINNFRKISSWSWGKVKIYREIHDWLTEILIELIFMISWIHEITFVSCDDIISVISSLSCY